MGFPGFTFVNATGTPSLTKDASKQVRGHVTKTVFATRRQRLARPERRDDEKPWGFYHAQSLEPAVLVQKPLSELELVMAVSEATTRTEAHQAGVLLNEFWSSIFLHGTNNSARLNDAAWLNLLISDKAFVEATMAAAMRWWARDSECTRRAQEHSSKAIKMVIDRVNSKGAYTDAYIATTLTLALKERFEKNNAAWEMYIGGVIDAIGVRRSRGIDLLPPSFTNILILDSINSIFESQGMFHQGLVAELGNHADGIMRIISATSQRIIKLREIVTEHRNRWAESKKVPHDVEKLWFKCYIEVKVLQRNHNSHVQAAATAFQLILFFLANINEDSSLWDVAEVLKAKLSDLPGRSCLYMDLTSCQVVLGAVAARKGSEARVWFVDKLKMGMEAMLRRGWNDPFQILERRVAVDPYVLGRLRALRLEICPEN